MVWQQFVCVMVVLTLTEITGQKVELSNAMGILKSYRMRSLSLLGDMCFKRFGEDAANDLKESTMNIFACEQQILDEINQKINPIIQNDWHEIIREGCSSVKQYMKCSESSFKAIQNCLYDQERGVMNISLKITHATIDYVCYNDGERIALFLESSGLECVRSQMNNIDTCVKEKLQGVNLTEMSSIVFNEQICRIMNDVPQCVVGSTGKCNDPTPSDILDSLRKHILKMTPCWDENSAPTLLFHSSYLLVHLLTLVTVALTAANILI